MVAPAIWIDREAEVRRLAEAIQKREGLLIWGPAGAGKTALVSKVLAELTPEMARRCLYVSGSESPQEFLRQLFQRLYEAQDPYLLHRLRADAIHSQSFGSWLKAQTSLRLKGLLYHAAKENDYWIFLDHLPPVTGAVKRVMEELIRMRKTPVYLLARGFTPLEVGRAWDIYWTERHRLALKPLAKPTARELLEMCIARFDLSGLDLEDFREEVLYLSDGAPGPIVRMCELAAEPKYHFGRRVKTKVLYLDYLVTEHSEIA